MFGIPRRAATFDVVFDDARLNEDLEHASAAGRSVGHAARRRLVRDGIAASALRPCEPEARDGTRLPGSVKTYLPPGSDLRTPEHLPGAWGMVFAVRADAAGRPYLEYLAFGERHPERQSRFTVYQVADRRLRAL
ncbi:hypothetical protein BH20ACT18_BH20ACT18_05710 [soil metagenome]